MRKRVAVPTLAHCESTIAREVRYWQRNLRRLLTADDLRQHALLAALRALDKFDPKAGVSFETFLTTCIRNEFRSLATQTATALLRLNQRQRDGLAEYVRNREPVRTDKSIEASLMLRRLALLTPRQLALVRVLGGNDGNISETSRDLGWPLAKTRQEVLAIRHFLTHKPKPRRGVS